MATAAPTNGTQPVTLDTFVAETVQRFEDPLVGQKNRDIATATILYYALEMHGTVAAGMSALQSGGLGGMLGGLLGGRKGGK